MHAVLAPSSAHRWVHCPGSVKAEQLCPQKPSEAAREGTAAHWVASETLNQWVKHDGGCPSCNSYIDQTAPNGVLINDFMAEAAQEYVNDILKVTNKYGCLRSLVIETPVLIPRVHDLNRGTPDCWAHLPEHGLLIIWDFKFGYGPVECYENWQQIDYTIGITDQITGGNGLNDQHLNVEMRIVQPRAFHPEGTCRSWKLKASNLRGLANQLNVAANQSQLDEPPVKAGTWCRHCSASKACHTFQKEGAEIADRVEILQLNDLTPEAASFEIDYLRKAETLIKERLEALETEQLEQMKQGVKCPGWSIGRGRPTVKWIKDDAEVIALGDLIGVDLRKKEQPITPIQAKKLKVDQAVINSYSKKYDGKLEIVRDSETIAARIFKNNEVK